MSAGRDRAREQLVRIAVADDPATAEIWRAALRDAGVEALVKNANPLTALSGGAVLSLEVWVLQGDADEALTVLGAEPAAGSAPRESDRRHAPRYHRRRRPGERGDQGPPLRPDAS